ncbi:ABC transporter substrate-binding protein [Fusobacterium necrophorum]|uniref:Receptor family ligand-binding protein n=2 Tax=Fusobacterium necrophorum TaxID=859 RepID=A0AAN3VUV8_9FUSO|nr:ABC transporter substrate-binding protein [Fusobacterium necrophorum]AYV95861.1 ABC transporter substrate-binding protein [Fusobacterium necrophorum subsp. funduliforme]EJU15968.1 receptor family ligand-binding protein [Fusobacterium necrophorum subsp. funduliforme Fnf 1007]KYL02864.1 amino acid-binding protein [Fusobacterium necrophorum subsp. funduliforme]KYM39067.1 amino acid-binding protein [Fusobacterium necrophorum subsp. funduliforme]KYM50650.1 amino acid-binding protein [Fusobacteri
MKKWSYEVVAAALLFTACGGEKVGGSQGGEDTIKLGAAGPLTGALAIYGVSATNGTKLAIDEINKNGGILGKQIELNLLDEKGDTTEAVTAYNKLMDWGMVAYIGNVTSKPSVAVSELAAADGIPMITPSGTQFSITEAGDNIFRVCFTDPYQGEVLANLASEKLQAKTAAILINNSSDYSDGVAQAFIKKSQETGIKIVATEGYSDGDKDFKAQLTKLLPLNPDVIVVPDYYEQDALIASQAREIGLKSQFIGPDGWDGVIKTLDSSSHTVLEGALFTNHYAIDDSNEKVQHFVTAYRDRYKDEPSAFSALAYDAVYMLKSAMETVGSTDKEAVAKALREIDFNGVTGHLTFDEHNNPVKAVTIIKIENGEYKFDSTLEAK